jgi:hypothetical protein
VSSSTSSTFSAECYGYGCGINGTIGSAVTVATSSTPAGYSGNSSGPTGSSATPLHSSGTGGWNSIVGSPVATTTEPSGYEQSATAAVTKGGYDSEPSSSTDLSIVSSLPTSVCIPSALNASWILSGYQAVYAADYSGCAVDPYNAMGGVVSLLNALTAISSTNPWQRLSDPGSGMPIVNINGKAQIARDSSDWEDSYYTFEDQGGACG